MAQDGDTITYSATTDSSPVSEDVSNVNEMTIDYIDGAGGMSYYDEGGSGGRVENVTVSLANESTVYIWVPESADTYPDSGRYAGDDSVGGFGGASAEVSLSNTDDTDSSDEPFLAGSGGGGGSSGGSEVGGAGGRDPGTTGAGGTAPPAGGAEEPAGSPYVGNDGDGAIDDQNRPIVTGGSTSKGGGSQDDTGGEVQISYRVVAPNAPSDLSLTVQ